MKGCEITETAIEETGQKSYGKIKKEKREKEGRRVLRHCKTLYKNKEFAI